MTMRLEWLISAVWLTMLASPAPAAQLEHKTRQESAEIEFHYGLMPAAIVARHASEHPEAKMHGGAPSKSATHLVVALFEKRSGARISDAEVDATVTLQGGMSVRKRLESMKIADQLSYGGFFAMGVPGLYRIRVEARRPGIPGVSTVEFEHQVTRDR